MPKPKLSSMSTFLLYILAFKNAHSLKLMSSRNILKEHKSQSPCKLSQAQILKFRHVELAGKNLSNFSTWFRAETWFPPLLLAALTNQILAVLEWSFPLKCIYLISLSECRQVTRTPSWLQQQDGIWSSEQLTHMGENLWLFSQIEILVFQPTLVLNSLSVP